MGSKRFRNCEKMQESCEKIARKLRETLLAKSRGTPQKLNKIKGFRKISTIKTRSFQDRLVMTTSISLRIYDALVCIIYTELLRNGSRALLVDSTSHTPPEDRQARLSNAGCGYLRRQAKYPYIIMHTCTYLSI